MSYKNYTAEEINVITKQIIKLKDNDRKTFVEIGKMFNLHYSKVARIYKIEKRKIKYIFSIPENVKWTETLPNRLQFCLRVYNSSLVKVDGPTKEQILADIKTGRILDIVGIGKGSLELLCKTLNIPVPVTFEKEETVKEKTIIEKITLTNDVLLTYLKEGLKNFIEPPIYLNIKDKAFCTFESLNMAFISPCYVQILDKTKSVNGNTLFLIQTNKKYYSWVNSEYFWTKDQILQLGKVLKYQVTQLVKGFKNV